MREVLWLSPRNVCSGSSADDLGAARILTLRADGGAENMKFMAPKQMIDLCKTRSAHWLLVHRAKVAGYQLGPITIPHTARLWGQGLKALEQ